MMHQVNYSQINQFCRITALCLWTVFHCMPLHHTSRPSKLRELQPDQHTQTIEKVGLRDRGRCGTRLEEPLLFIVRPVPKVLVPALFSLAALQSESEWNFLCSPLDGSTSAEALIDTWLYCSTTTHLPSDCGARSETAVTQWVNLIRETLKGTFHGTFFPQYCSVLSLHYVQAPRGRLESYQAPAVNRQHKLPISSPSSWRVRVLVCVLHVCVCVCEISWYLS